MTRVKTIDEYGLDAIPIPVDLSILVPTLNERENVGPLTDQLTYALQDLGRSWELIFIDDSDDSTPDLIRELQNHNRQVSLVHRERGQRAGGLGSAVAAGICEARGRVIVIMDGDLQHPPQMVRELSTAVLSGTYDLAIASRYVPGASSAGLNGSKRRVASRLSVLFAHLLVPRTRKIRDPMSGFFAVSRERLPVRSLRPHGFKILMEILARGGNLRVAEVPFQMNPRAGGKSKASFKEGVRFLRHAGRLVRSRWSTSAVGKRVLTQLPLVGILAVQFVLTYRLVFNNTAFIDEATYLSAGQYEIHVLLHGGTNLYFPTYFSGAPTIYPFLGDLANKIGGLHAARFLSLGFMLIATVLCFDTTRRLWSRTAGWFAAAVFVTTEGTQFLGALATYDAMALMLMALAAWLAVRFAVTVKTSNAILIVAPVLVFANATKYASTIFDPIIFLLAYFVMLQYHGRRPAFRTSVALTATFCVMLAATLAIAPITYLTGISLTTLNRATSNISPKLVLLDSWGWVGGIACIAFFTVVVSVLLAWRRKIEWPVVGIICTLAFATLLAPAEEARIHTLTSLFKHVTFGAWFGAIAAGWLLHFLTRLRLKKAWSYVVNTIFSTVFTLGSIPLLVVGTHQAYELHNNWWNSTRVVNALRPLVTNLNRPVLMDDASVAEYYLQNRLPLPFWHDQYYSAFTPAGTTKKIFGLHAYADAVRQGWFGVIALDWAKKRQDNAIASAISQSKRYAWVGNFTSGGATSQRTTYVVWQLRRSKS